MKILFITNSPIEYSLSANIRNIALIKGLLVNKHNIDIFTCYPDKKAKFYDPTIIKDLNLPIKYFDRDNDIKDQIFVNVKYKKFHLYHKIRNFLYKLYNALSIYDPRQKNLRFVNKIKIDKIYDLVISSSDPKSSHLIAEKIVEKFRIKKWIQYWGDPLTGDINKKCIIPKFVLKKEELRLLKKANAAFYVSPITLNLQKKMFEEVSEKLYYLPIPIQTIKCKENKIKLKEKIKIGYYGDYFRRDRNIIPLVETCSKNDFFLEIFGNSDVQIINKNNIQINTRTTFEIIKGHEENIDILVCICNKKGGQIPGKIYHYAATDKPILLILDGEYKQTIYNFFGVYSNYFICENNEFAIKEAIKKIQNFKLALFPISEFAAKSIAFNMIDKIK